MALIDVYFAYKGAGRLLERVAGACLEAAGDIRVEDPGTTNHTNRIIWMGEVHSNALQKARDMIPRILDNAVIGANPEGASDNDIQFVVNNLINEFATG
jgi:hypothetical protein